METIPALPRYSVWCPTQENFLVGRKEGREGGREEEREDMFMH